MMHIKFNSQKILPWSIRLIASYLFVWWALLYVSFAANIEVFPLNILDYIKAIILGMLGSSSLFLSTIKYQGRLKQVVVVLLIFFGFVYYLYFSIGKVIFVDILGLGSHILATVCFIKLNFQRGIKWLTC
ncbi:hypothetical protein DID74_01495 [Candidatus Marinamargulisbacteria bacterium SCGC AG-333-B06]|nr:hypothetical protein DID74_01495 [Candidatus Marinamargulisbacteria bacterium SCGC AG-333-B06]